MLKQFSCHPKTETQCVIRYNVMSSRLSGINWTREDSLLSSFDELTEDGDLGLGQGAKPGGILSDIDAITECNLLPVVSSNLNREFDDSSSESTSGYSSLVPSRSGSRRLSRNSCGSSLCETKVLRLHEEIDKISRSLRKISSEKGKAEEDNDEALSAVSLMSLPTPIDVRTFHQRNVADKMEIDSLQNEIEAYKTLLNSKCEAIRLLRSLLKQVDAKREEDDNKLRDENMQLKSQISKLQYQIDYQESVFQDGQATWLDRYNSMCEKYTVMNEDVRKNAEVSRKLNNEKSVLNREKSELLALLDSKERKKYERSNSFSSDDCYGSISSGELAVLGACVCRGAKMEPCKCARAACAKQKEIQHLQHQIDKRTTKIRELRNITDVYKKAFVDQQKKTSYLLKRNSLLEAIVETSHRCKEKSLKGSQVVDALTDMLCEKNEAFVHQQMVTKFLARKISEIEHSASKELNET